MTMYFRILSFLLIACPFVAQAELDYSELILRASQDPREMMYQIDYRIDCKGLESKGPPGLAGEIFLASGPEKVIRFDLFQGKHRTLISLGPASTFPGGRVVIRPHQNSECKIQSIQTKLVYQDLLQGDFDKNLHLLAQRHSPYIVVRKDQYTNRSGDIPLDLVYSTIRDEKNHRFYLRYTAFFSDEDSKPTAKLLEQQMARYGRMTDVEWVYEVVFDLKTAEIIHSRFQGSVHGKLKTGELAGDHSSLKMRGDYWPSSNHPILYNVANNNVFSDFPMGEEQKYRYVAYHLGLLPDHRVEAPHARERFQLSDQGLYMYLVSELEAKSERKLPRKASDYLFFLVSGRLLPNQTPLNLHNGAFKLRVSVYKNDTLIYRTKSFYPIDRLGEDLFGQETVAGVRMEQGLLDDLVENQLVMKVEILDARNLISTDLLRIEELMAFRLTWDQVQGRYVKEEVPFLKVEKRGKKRNFFRIASNP